MEKKYHSESYNPSSCCGADCFAYGKNENEPCWGDVFVAAEEGCGDDWWWIHECQGHEDCYDASCYSGDGKYKVEPKREENINADN
jgi:hypothetical protein